MSGVITRDSINRKTELANTVAQIATLVAKGEVTGILGVVFLRDGSRVEVQDFRTVSLAPLVGALDILKAKALNLATAPRPVAAEQADQPLSPVTPIRQAAEQPPAP